jgi:hypothetical protein
LVLRCRLCAFFVRRFRQAIGVVDQCRVQQQDALSDLHLGCLRRFRYGRLLLAVDSHAEELTNLDAVHLAGHVAPNKLLLWRRHGYEVIGTQHVPLRYQASSICCGHQGSDRLPQYGLSASCGAASGTVENASSVGGPSRSLVVLLQPVIAAWIRTCFR